MRLAEKLGKSSAAIRERMLALAGDVELRVRYQVAFSLGELANSKERNAALVKLAKRDAGDGYVRVAVLSSLAEGAGDVLRRVPRQHASAACRGRESPGQRRDAEAPAARLSSHP